MLVVTFISVLVGVFLTREEWSLPLEWRNLRCSKR